jgi:hypothetical protein
MAKFVPNVRMPLNIQTRESVEYTSKPMISLAKGVHGDPDAREAVGMVSMRRPPLAWIQQCKRLSFDGMTF